MKSFDQFGNRNSEQYEDDHAEGSVAKAIETQTAKLPSDIFLWIAGGAIAGSLTLRIMGKKEAANWVGEWAPTILILGVYNKIVKVLGHDKQNRASQLSEIQ